MTAPRHLWSGDWRRDSAARARELEARRPPGEQLEAEQPAPEEPRVERAAAAPVAVRRPPGPPLSARVRHWLEAARHGLGRWRSGWPVGRTAIIVLATLLSAGVAYAAVSALVGSGGRSPSAASKAPAWLGVEMASFALGGGFPSGGGALVTNVTPGSPAGVAGLEPGDLITQIGNRAIATPADVNATLAGMHAGDHVEIQYQRGPFADSAEITLTARPAGGP